MIEIPQWVTEVMDRLLQENSQLRQRLSEQALDLAEFFANVDAAELEKAALDRLGFGDAGATQAMLDVLREWAVGDGH